MLWRAEGTRPGPLGLSGADANGHRLAVEFGPPSSPSSAEAASLGRARAVSGARVLFPSRGAGASWSTPADAGASGALGLLLAERGGAFERLVRDLQLVGREAHQEGAHALGSHPRLAEDGLQAEPVDDRDQPVGRLLDRRDRPEDPARRP